MVWLLFPLSPGSQAAEEGVGNEARYEALIRSVQARNPNLVVLDMRHPRFGSSFFHDGGHLDRDGSLAISEALADALRGECATTSRGRWVTVAAGQAPADTVAVEDLTQTWAAIHSPKGDRRRR